MFKQCLESETKTEKRTLTYTNALRYRSKMQIMVLKMNEEIVVRTFVIGKDDEGFDTPTVTDTELFCEVKSSSYVDRYADNANNIIPSIVFEMRREDFDMCRVTVDKKHVYPSEVDYDGATYKLVRWRYEGKGKAQMICG